jgi:hypothetical protein
MTGDPYSFKRSPWFLALGAIAVAWIGYRIVDGIVSAMTVAGVAARGTNADELPSGWRMATTHPGPLSVILLMLVAGAVVLSRAVLLRRPWARLVAMGLLVASGAAGFGVAAFQVRALFRGAGAAADEIGYGHLLSMWRALGVIAGVGIALFSVAALARLASDRVRREFGAAREELRPTEPRRPL